MATNLLSHCLQRRDILFTTGKQRESIIEQFSNLPLIVPDLEDHIEAATLQTTCRRKGVPIGTVDALIAQLAVGHDLELLTTDQAFVLVARHVPLRLLEK